MRQPIRDRDLPTMNNSLLNHQQIHSSFQEIHNQGMLPSSNFDPASSHEDFLDQILSSVPSSAASFPWADDQTAAGIMGNMEEQSPTTLLTSKMRQQQISNGAAKALMLQQQLLLSRGFANGTIPHAEQNGVAEAPSFNSNLANDASVKALFNGFTGSVGQTANQLQHFQHTQGGALHQTPSFGASAASGSSRGAAAGQPKQRVRARRGQATDPHSIAERLRRERIAERMKSLQELVPNANKTDKASMLDEIIDYVKFLQLQVKVLSMSRLGGAPLVADKSPEGKSTQTASSSNKEDGMTVTEKQVAKMMEEDMGSAMQYLQGKGLCLMPISLATAISTATSHSRNPLPQYSNNQLLNGEAGRPLSPSMSVLTVQSAAIGGNVAGEASVKDGSAAASKFD